MEQRKDGKNRNQIASDTPKSNHINNDIKCKWSKCPKLKSRDCQIELKRSRINYMLPN